MSTTICTPLHSSCSSDSAGSSSTRSSMYEKPEQPPPLTPTRRRVLSSGRLWSLMIDLISLAALSLSVMGMGNSPVRLVFLDLQPFQRDVNSTPRHHQVRHPDLFQKSDKCELQRLYRRPRSGDAGEIGM